MGNKNRFFRILVEEKDSGTGVIVSANADREYILRNLVTTMLEHELMFDIITSCAGIALQAKERAEEMGITTAELVKRMTQPDSECDCPNCSSKSKEDSNEVKSCEETMDPKNQELINAMKKILNGGN